MKLDDSDFVNSSSLSFCKARLSSSRVSKLRLFKYRTDFDESQKEIQLDFCSKNQKDKEEMKETIQVTSKPPTNPTSKGVTTN